MTPTPETHQRSVLYMLAHDEWCSHDEADDGVECDCHLSVIASLRKRLVETDNLLVKAEAAYVVVSAEVSSIREQLAAMTTCRDHWKTSYEDVRKRLEELEERHRLLQEYDAGANRHLDTLRRRLEGAEALLILEAKVSTARGYQAIELGKRLEEAEKVLRMVKQYFDDQRPVDLYQSKAFNALLRVALAPKESP